MAHKSIAFWQMPVCLSGEIKQCHVLRHFHLLRFLGVNILRLIRPYLDVGG